MKYFLDSSVIKDFFFFLLIFDFVKGLIKYKLMF